MSAISDIIQLQNLDAKIKLYNKELKDLRTAKKECESRIIDYCTTNDLPGVKYNDVTIVVEKKQKNLPFTKTDKLNRGEVILNRYGIVNSKEALAELFDAMKGEPEDKIMVKILGNNN
jgi:hypothetical protein